jgi:hypothetical protein
MTLQLTLEMDNAAFECEPHLPNGNNGRTETARILSRLANQLERNPGQTEGRLLDANGNAVGQWRIR